MTPKQLQDHLLTHIPLARAMELRVLPAAAGRLRLQAPLAANCNDKGCAFGGSLASLMTLAGWGCAVLALGEEGARAEVYVQDSELRYLAPVWQTIEVEAWLEPADAAADYARTYASRGRARTVARAQCLLDDGRIAATLNARFVAIDPRRPAPAQRVDEATRHATA